MRVLIPPQLFIVWSRLAWTGKQFDPKIVAAFSRVFDSGLIVSIALRHRETIAQTLVG